MSPELLVEALVLTLTSTLGAHLGAEQVVVTGSRTETRADDAAVATEVITEDVIRASGAENLAEVLEEHPGADVTRSFAGAGLRLRGLDAQHVLILIDGQRVPGRVNGTVDLSRIPVERIARVEVVKGAASALYGSDALGGVVNVITKPPPNGVSARVHGRMDSLSTTDASGTVGWGEEDWSASLTGGYHRAPAYDLNPDDAATNGSAFEEMNVEAKGALDLSDDVQLSLGADVYRRASDGIDVGPPLPSGNRAVYDRTNRTTTGRALAGVDAHFGLHRVRLDGQASFFSDDFALDQRGRAGAGSLDRAQRTREQLGQLTLQFDSAYFEDHLLSAGLVGLYERLESERLDGGVGDRGRLAAFAQDEWSILDGRITVVPGIRVDLDTSFGVYPTPKLSVRAEPAAGLILRASHGWGFRAPDFKEQLLIFENPGAGYVVEGNLDLSPETSRSVDVGMDWRPASRVRVRVDLYYNWIDDLILTESAGSAGPGAPQRFQYANVGAAITRGVESAVELALLEGVQLDIGYTFLDAQDLDRDRFLEGRARHRVTYTLRAEYPPLGLSGAVRGSWVSARPFYADTDDGFTTREAEPYVTLDVRAEQTISDHFAVFLGGDNLLGAGDPEFLAIPPRSVFGGIDARY